MKLTKKDREAEIDYYARTYSARELGGMLVELEQRFEQFREALNTIACLKEAPRGAKNLHGLDEPNAAAIARKVLR